MRAAGFTGALGSTLPVPDADGRLVMALAGYGTQATRARGRFHLAAAAAALPDGAYRLEGLPHGRAAEEALGWLLAGYGFERYRTQSPQ
ncbi:MAG: leucyl aminopeptidase, partial [Rhodocyclales bacterium CG_4_9_14_3_um_filter_68_10]